MPTAPLLSAVDEQCPFAPVDISCAPPRDGRGRAIGRRRDFETLKKPGSVPTVCSCDDRRLPEPDTGQLGDQLLVIGQSEGMVPKQTVEAMGEDSNTLSAEGVVNDLHTFGPETLTQLRALPRVGDEDGGLVSPMRLGGPRLWRPGRVKDPAGQSGGNVETRRAPERPGTWD